MADKRTEKAAAEEVKSPSSSNLEADKSRAIGGTGADQLTEARTRARMRIAPPGWALKAESKRFDSQEVVKLKTAAVPLMVLLYIFTKGFLRHRCNVQSITTPMLLSSVDSDEPSPARCAPQREPHGQRHAGHNAFIYRNPEAPHQRGPYTWDVLDAYTLGT
jgi:hypothetical protein